MTEHTHTAVCWSSFFPTSSLAFIIYKLFDDSHSGMSLYLIVVLICIFLIINNAEHLFMCLFMYVSFEEFHKCFSVKTQENKTTTQEVIYPRLETVRIKLVKDFIDEPMLAAKLPHSLYCILECVLINIVGM